MGDTTPAPLAVAGLVCVASMAYHIVVFLHNFDGVILAPFSYSSMGVVGKKMVKVLRLREPVRGGQTTLD